VLLTAAAKATVERATNEVGDRRAGARALRKDAIADGDIAALAVELDERARRLGSEQRETSRDVLAVAERAKKAFNPGESERLEKSP
jgi:hypothetical protein